MTMLSDDEIYAMYNEPRSDAEMLEFARELITAHTAKLLEGVEMPEPTIIKDMDWCENETYDIGDLQQYAAAAAAQARVKALDEAKQACLAKHANGNWKHDTREECADAIEEMKGKV